MYLNFNVDLTITTRNTTPNLTQMQNQTLISLYSAHWMNMCTFVNRSVGLQEVRL